MIRIARGIVAVGCMLAVTGCVVVKPVVGAGVAVTTTAGKAVGKTVGTTVSATAGAIVGEREEPSEGH